MSHWYTPGSAARGATWCGPYAIAVVCATPYDPMYETISAILGKRLRRMHWSQLCKVLHCMDVRYTQLKTVARVRPNMADLQTLTQWYATRPDRTGTYVVLVTGHYVVVRGTRITDTLDQTWIPFHQRRRCKRSRVQAVLQITS